MTHSVPNWNVQETHHLPLPALRVPAPPPPPDTQVLGAQSNSSSIVVDAPSFDYQVKELTWNNGNVAILHGLCPDDKISAAANGGLFKYAWENQLPAAGGTLESVVNQATAIIPPPGGQPNVHQTGCCGRGRKRGGDELVPWMDNRRQPQMTNSTDSLGTAVDALVPCSNKKPRNNDGERSFGTLVVGCSATNVGSCSVTTANGVDAGFPRVSCAAGGQSMSGGSASYGRESRQVTVETGDRELVSLAFTSNSLGSPGNTSSAKQCTKAGEEHDSACQSMNEASHHIP